MNNLLHSPDNFRDHVNRYVVNLICNFSLCLHLDRFASAIILEIGYGHKVESDDDPYLELADQFNDAVAGLGGIGFSVVDFFPICSSYIEVSGLVTEYKHFY